MINLLEIMKGRYDSLFTGTTLSFDTTTYQMSDEVTYCSGVIAHEAAANLGGVPEHEVATDIFNTESFVPKLGKLHGKTVPFKEAINSVSGPDMSYRHGFFAEGTSKKVVVEIMEAFALAMINRGCTRWD